MNIDRDINLNRNKKKTLQELLYETKLSVKKSYEDSKEKELKSYLKAACLTLSAQLEIEDQFLKRHRDTILSITAIPVDVLSMLPTFQEQIHHLVDSLWIISRFKHRREDEELLRAYIYIMNLIVNETTLLSPSNYITYMLLDKKTSLLRHFSCVLTHSLQIIYQMHSAEPDSPLLAEFSSSYYELLRYLFNSHLNKHLVLPYARVISSTEKIFLLLKDFRGYLSLLILSSSILYKFFETQPSYAFSLMSLFMSCFRGCTQENSESSYQHLIHSSHYPQIYLNLYYFYYYEYQQHQQLDMSPILKFFQNHQNIHDYLSFYQQLFESFSTFSCPSTEVPPPLPSSFSSIFQLYRSSLQKDSHFPSFFISFSSSITQYLQTSHVSIPTVTTLLTLLLHSQTAMDSLSSSFSFFTPTIHSLHDLYLSFLSSYHYINILQPLPPSNHTNLLGLSISQFWEFIDTNAVSLTTRTCCSETFLSFLCNYIVTQYEHLQSEPSNEQTRYKMLLLLEAFSKLVLSSLSMMGCLFRALSSGPILQLLTSFHSYQFLKIFMDVFGDLPLSPSTTSFEGSSSTYLFMLCCQHLQDYLPSEEIIDLYNSSGYLYKLAHYSMSMIHSFFNQHTNLLSNYTIFYEAIFSYTIFFSFLSTAVHLHHYTPFLPSAFPYIHFSNEDLHVYMIEHYSFIYSVESSIDYYYMKIPAIPHQNIDFSSQFRIHRENLLVDSYGIFRALLKNHQLQSRFFVIFIDENNKQEEGVDGGGLSRELMSLLIQDLFSPELGLFAMNDSNELYPDPTPVLSKSEELPATTNPSILSARAEITSETIGQWYQFAGEVVGRMLLTHQVPGINLAPFFLTILSGQPIILEDMKYKNRQIYESYLSILHTSDDRVLSEYTFSTTVWEGNQYKEIPLIDNGQTTVVTNQNKHIYIQKLYQYQLYQSIYLYCNSFYQGILDALQFNLFSLLSPTSVQLILYGDRNSFDLKNLKKFSKFVYFSPQTTIEFGGSDEENCLVSILEEQGLGQYQMELLNVVRWFWETLEEMSGEELLKLLMFTTGASNPPIGGFQHLVPAFSVHFFHPIEGNPLPSSSTCFNLLKVPVYSSREEFKTKLLFAITNTEGFSRS